MPSLSKFAFWSFVLGIALFVLSSAPLSVISVPEGQEGTFFMFSMVLVLVGLASYITAGELSSLERNNAEHFDSIWRNFDSTDAERQKDFDNLSRRMDSIEG